jgi:hypothetical protein
MARSRARSYIEQMSQKVIWEDLNYPWLCRILRNYHFYAGCWWFASVIVATQEAEIRRIVIQSQSVPETLS